MLGDVRVERIGRKRFAAADQLEAIGGYDQMQIPEFVAHGAVAVDDFELRRCDHFESDAPAMTATGVGTHARWLALVLLCGEIADQGNQTL